MSLLSQVGMVILIIFMILLIKESNTQVRYAMEEGEKKEITTSFENEVEVEFEKENLILMSQPPKQSVKLILLDENHYPKREISVDSLPFSIGRGKENSLVLDDLCVARKHCQLTESEGCLLLRDLGSMNKIYSMGGLHQELVLKDGSHFYIGNEEFLARIKPGEVYGRKKNYQYAG